MRHKHGSFDVGVIKKTSSDTASTFSTHADDSKEHEKHLKWSSSIVQNFGQSSLSLESIVESNGDTSLSPFKRIYQEGAL